MTVVDDDEDALLLHDDEGGLATMVSRLAGVEGQPTMHRIDLSWRQRPVVQLLECDEPSSSSSSSSPSSSSALFTSHETAELRGCGEGGKDGTAVVHRFRLADAAPSRALALEAIRAAAASPGETVSNRAGSWHSAADVLLEDGGWPRDTADALGATLRDAVRLAWGAADEDSDSDGDGNGDGDGDKVGEVKILSKGMRAAAEKFASSATVQAWLNVSPPGGFHRRHEHGGALFSGALYCAVPEAEMRGEGEEDTMESVHSAALVFCPENGTGSFAALSPEVGSLVLFPGWLVHCVLPMRTATGAGAGGDVEGEAGDGRAHKGHDEQRVSASFNAYRKGDALRALLAQKMRQRDAVLAAAAAAAAAREKKSRE